MICAHVFVEHIVESIVSKRYFRNVLSFVEKEPFMVIDCSRQNESVKSATVDVRIEFNCKKNVPTNTTVYCLIIHDRVAQYNPLTNVVRKIT